jgi:hypothetical protein
MVCWHRRYKLGDAQPHLDPQQWHEEERPKDAFELPLYLYDHGGITMRTGAFGCPWDSGQVGWIYITPEKARECFTLKPEDPIDEDRVLELLRAEVKEYDQYLTGDIWYFVLEKGTTCGDCGHTTWEHEDSCGGFYANDKDEDNIAMLRDHIIDEVSDSVIEEAWNNRE